MSDHFIIITPEMTEDSHWNLHDSSLGSRLEMIQFPNGMRIPSWMVSKSVRDHLRAINPAGSATLLTDPNQMD